jgi:general secretion pathway protein G
MRDAGTAPSHARRTGGFTLLEMLVVILIIGMLTGIVAPRLLGQLAKSEITTARAQLSSLDKAVQAFRIDMGRFPTTEEGLNVLTTAPPNETRWHGPYLQGAIPMDPWGKPYQYAVPGPAGRDYALSSAGRDNTPVTLP